MTVSIWTSRPASIEDLSDHERSAHVVADISGLQWCTAYPEVGQHLFAALAAARDVGLDIGPDGRIAVPLTEDETAAALDSAQRSWDRARDRYLAAIEDPTSVPGYGRYTVNAFAAREGREPIDWPASA